MHSDLRQITHPKMQNYQAKSSHQVFNDYSFVPSNRKEKQPGRKLGNYSDRCFNELISSFFRCFGSTPWVSP